MAPEAAPPPAISILPFLTFRGSAEHPLLRPAFAAIMALVNQQTGQRQGNPNYVLYKLAGKSGSTCTSAANPANTCIFYDIPAGSNNSVACAGGSFGCSNQSNAGNQFGILEINGTPSFNTTANYDLATGLGSVNVTNLVKNWASVLRHSSHLHHLSTRHRRTSNEQRPWKRRRRRR